MRIPNMKLAAQAMAGPFGSSAVFGAIALMMGIGCGSDDRSVGVFGDGTDSGAPGDGSSAGPSSATATDGEDSSGPGGEDSEDGGIKLDVGFVGDVPGGCMGDEQCGGCTYVDLLFVIDNSGSMGKYQNALALAFPAFAETLGSTLPPGTNVHVGVTSSEMGYSGMGTTSINNGVCTFTGDGGQPGDAFYVTPDQDDTGRNGAQGRLYDPGGGQHYFEFDTDGGAAQLEALSTWFSSAATIGEGGSNIEMLSAPVGWVAHEANAATNAGFIRDEGSVLVVFFVQDEPDQTPMTIDGTPGGQFVLERISEAKVGCGGTDCIIAGGFLNANACSVTGNLPIDDFLEGVSATVVQALPDAQLATGDPQAAADQMNELLSDTLAEVIAQTCETIPPAG
jgi:hypothetical protein